MYLDVNSNASIFKQWVKKLENIDILNPGSIHLKIRDVVLDEGLRADSNKLSKNNLLQKFVQHKN